MHNTLESSKIFPYVAWTLVIGFALFTLNLTMHLRQELTYMGDSINHIDTKLDTTGTKTIQ